MKEVMIHKPTRSRPSPSPSPSPSSSPPQPLPPALLAQVFHHLSTVDLFSASQVSRPWRHTVFLSKPFSPTLLRPHLSVLRAHFGNEVVPHRIPIPAVEKLLTRFVRETDPALFTTTATYHLPTTAPSLTAACPSHLCVSQAKKTHVYACSTTTPLTHVLSIPTPRARALSLTGAYLATTTSCGKTTLRVLKPLLKLYSITVPDTLDVCLLPHHPREEPLLAVLSRSGVTLVHPEYAMFVIRERQLRGKRPNPWVIHVPAEIGGGGGRQVVATGDGRGLVVCGTHLLGSFFSLQDTKEEEVSTNSLWKHYNALPRTLRRLPGSNMSHLRDDTFVGRRSSGVLALISIDTPIPSPSTPSSSSSSPPPTGTFLPIHEGATVLPCGAHAIAVVTPHSLSIISTATGHERTIHRVAQGVEVKAVHADKRRVILVMKDRLVVVSLWSGGRNGSWRLSAGGTVCEGGKGGKGIGCCAVM